MAGEDEKTSPQVPSSRAVSVDAAGNVIVPASLAAKLGVHEPDDLVWECKGETLSVTGDRLRKVYVEATSVCNLDCRMCVRHSWDQSPGHMPIERYRRLLEGLPEDQPGELTLAFSGFGEPMIHPEFLEMLRLAHDRELRVEIITNGTLLDEVMAGALVSLGVAQVTVSVDGGSDAAYAALRGSSWEPILEGIAALREARRRGRRRLRLGVACVATRQNAASLPALLQLAGRLNLDFVSIGGLLPHTPELEKDIVWDRAASEADCEPASWRPRLSIARMDLNDATRPLIQAVGQQVPIVPSPAFDTAPGRHYCRFAHEGMLAVAWDGRVAPCLSLLHTHPEHVKRQVRTIYAYSVGSVDERSLKAVWHDPAFRAFRRRVRDFDFPPCFSCGPCPLTETNQEDCYGSPLPACGLCLWAQGIVLCP